jgi:hypothetical protein
VSTIRIDVSYRQFVSTLRIEFRIGDSYQGMPSGVPNPRRPGAALAAEAVVGKKPTAEKS